MQAREFFVVNGGCAANAAVAVARLGGRASLAGPMGGPAGEDENGDRVLKALAREKVDCSACQRIDGLATALSAIFMNARGDRTIVTYRDERIATAAPHDPERAVSGLTRCWRTIVFRNSFGRSAKRRGAAICGSYSTVISRRSRTIRCFASPRMSCFPRSACARPPASLISLRACCALPANRRFPCGQQRAERHPLSLSRPAPRCRFSGSAPWTRSPPATRCMALLRSRSP